MSLHVHHTSSNLSSSRHLTALTGKLTEAIAAYPKLSVVVRGDGETSFQQVAEVLAACRKAGVADLGITVQIAKRDHSLR